MEFLTKFFQSLFSGIDPVTVALWVRGFFAAVWSGIGVGVVDILAQLLVQLQSTEPFAINWQLVARTVAIAVIPVLIAFFKKAPTQN